MEEIDLVVALNAATFKTTAKMTGYIMRRRNGITVARNYIFDYLST